MRSERVASDWSFALHSIGVKPLEMKLLPVPCCSVANIVQTKPDNVGSHRLLSVLRTLNELHNPGTGRSDAHVFIIIASTGAIHADPASGFSLLDPPTAKKPGIYVNRNHFPCPGDRGDHGGLQRGVCGADGPVPLCQRRPHGSSGGEGSRPGTTSTSP